MTQKPISIIRAHIESHYPVLYLVTHEETDTDALISELAEDRNIIEWNMARGLVDFKTKQPQIQYCDLADALENLLDQELDNHFIVIRDAHMGLRDQPLAVARLKALVTRVLADSNSAVTIFLVSSKPYVPPELEKFITLFDMPLPDEDAIRAIIQEYVNAYEISMGTDVLDKRVISR